MTSGLERRGRFNRRAFGGSNQGPRHCLQCRLDFDSRHEQFLSLLSDMTGVRDGTFLHQLGNLQVFFIANHVRSVAEVVVRPSDHVRSVA